MDTQHKTYSNPAMTAVVADWPMGGAKRGNAYFNIETDPKSGRQRAVRVTTGAAKKMTYAQKARIVDGDDGRTYIAELTVYGFVNIMRGDMKYQEETIHPDNPRYAAVRALFDGGTP